MARKFPFPALPLPNDPEAEQALLDGIATIQAEAGYPPCHHDAGTVKEKGRR